MRVPPLTTNPSEPKISPRRQFMKFFGFWPLVLLGMVALLATVAVLQYRWTNEATIAAELRMGAELESLMLKWHADLYGELSAVCIAMQVGPDSGARDTWNDYLERYVEWKNAPPHEALPDVYRNPDLVQDIYIWDTNLQTKPQLFRLNAGTKKIETAALPQDLQTLLNRLRANSTSLSNSLRVWQLRGQPGAHDQYDSSLGTNSPASSTNTGWQFDETVPAIVHPIFQRDGRALSSQSPVDWMVIVLDLSVLQQRILPELSTRYFGGLEGLDYKVAVVATGARPRAIYSSDPGFVIQNIGAADSTLNIFGPPPSSGRDEFQRKGKNSRLLRSTEWHSFYGTAWFPVIEYESRPSSWVLVLERRAGPLQAVINRVRQKNLAISAFVLLLLAANFGILAIAGFRAQNFAKLQLDFVASVSHELRTPLTSIFCVAENIKDGIVGDKSSLTDYGSMVMSQARRLMDYVDRILLFASIRSGKERYNLRPLEVSEILQRVRRTMAALIIEESFVVEESVDSNLPYVVGDLFAVCSCVENLITNAIKYSPIDRRIRISANQHTMGDNSKQVAISVEDRGMGIKSSELKRIFEPFYRSPEATAAQIQGTGLGLSLARHLAEAMGGSLSVVSELGVGSTFTLHLLAVQTNESELSPLSSRTDEVMRNE